MSAIMKSVLPIECERIASGEQTILISKTRPKISTPFKCYIYQPIKKVYEIIEEYDSNFKLLRHKKILKEFSGKVIGEFICDEIIEIGNYQEIDHSYMLWVKDEETTEKLCQDACMNEFEIQKYLGKNGGYGWHISDLKIYDKPKELGEFYRPLKYDKDGVICGTKQEISNIYEWDCYTLFKVPNNCECTLLGCPKLREFYKITRPPQNWCYVES